MRRRFWRSDTAPFLEKQERILNEMAELVEIFVVFSQVFSVFLGGMTGIMPSLTALSMIASVSYPGLPEDIRPGIPQSAALQLYNPLWYQK